MLGLISTLASLRPACTCKHVHVMSLQQQPEPHTTLHDGSRGDPRALARALAWPGVARASQSANPHITRYFENAWLRYQRSC